MVAAIIILSAFLFFSICANIIFIKKINFDFCEDNDVLLVNIIPHIYNGFVKTERGEYCNDVIPQLEEVPVPFYNVEVYEAMEGVWIWRPILQ